MPNDCVLEPRMQKPQHKTATAAAAPTERAGRRDHTGEHGAFSQRHPRCPHFLLLTQATDDAERTCWQFVLRATDGSRILEVSEIEPDTRGERLELLSVVRGLEALEQPSQVTVVTPSRYVYQGLHAGLDDWRQNGWRWERHGQLVPVKNVDLWQRVDRALRYHRVHCRRWRIDAPHDSSRTAAVVPRRVAIADQAVVRSPFHGTRIKRVRLGLWRRWAERIDAWKLRFSQLGTSLVPAPWLG